MSALIIVNRLLEDEEQVEFPFDYGDHEEKEQSEVRRRIKDFMARHADDFDPDKYQQIDGDTDAWASGGSFYNPRHKTVVHLSGLDDEGLKDFEYWDIELTPEQMAEIQAQFPVQIDPEYPEGGDDNERARDEAIDELKIKLADEKNAVRRLPVYRFSVDPIVSGEEWFDEESIKSQFDDGVWDELNDAQKWCAVGQHHGWHELDHYPDNYTKAELEEYLGIKDLSHVR